MTARWRFNESDRYSAADLEEEEGRRRFRFDPDGQEVPKGLGAVMADALNVHEAIGRTPSQLQARVAELEAAVERALQIGHTLNFEHANDPTVDHNGRTADAVLGAYNGLRAVATSVGVWTK